MLIGAHTQTDMHTGTHTHIYMDECLYVFMYIYTEVYVSFQQNIDLALFIIRETKCILEVKVAQLCLTLCDPMDYTAHGILLARILEWVAIAFSRGSSQHRDRTQVSHIAGGFFTVWATREDLLLLEVSN